MAEFILGRIKFVYRNNWETSIAYVVDDVVTAGGRTYICISNHTSSPLFETDYDPNPELSKWNLVADGQQWRGDWDETTYYNSGDLVKWGGTVYQCNTAHTSSTYVSPTWLGLEDDSANWDIFATSFDWAGAWDYNTRYKVNDLVTYGGFTYVCTQKHISTSTTATLTATGFTIGAGTATLSYASQVVAPFAIGSTITLAGFTPTATSTPSNINTTHTVVSCSTTQVTFAITGTYTVSVLGTVTGTSELGLEKDSNKWESFNEGLTYLGDWVTNARYRKNDIVKWGADLWICLTPHMSTGFIANNSYWEIFVNGFQFENSWDIATTYQIGDTVTYGGYSYIAKSNNVGLLPTENTNDWAVYTTGFSFEGDWADNITYKIGSVVRDRGYTYLSLLDSPSITAEVTDTVASTDIITVSSTEGFVAGMTVIFDTTFGGLTAGVKYYVLAANLDTTEFQVSLTPGGSAVPLTDTNSQTVGIIVYPSVENTTYWVRLNTGLSWTNNTTTYTALTGTNVDSLGSGAKFDVVRSSTVYNVSVSTGFAGTNYAVGDTIKILGSAIGGISPVNDLIVTVGTVSSGSILSITWTGFSSTWKAGTVYALGDLVLYGANNYICVSSHAATTGNKPDSDTTATYWNLFSAGAESATLTTQGDTFYYGPSGPTRLPIGANGQVLRVADGYPVWETYGHIFNAVFVSPTGTDTPYPESGFSIDQPWKTIRYACKQVEDGYREPQAKALLQKNKQFLIKEVNNYIIYTYRASVTGTSGGVFLTADTSGLSVNMPITFSNLTGALTIGGSAINTSTVYYIKTIVAGVSFSISATAGGVQLGGSGSGTAIAKFSYNSSKAERDAAYIVEGLIFDLSHGGTQKTTENAISFYDVSGTAYITNMTGYQINQFIGSHVYLKTIVANILNNTAPAANYQSLNSATEVVYQTIDSTLTAEDDAVTVVQGLLDILIDGLGAGNTAAIPRALNPNTTINIKTGTYTEVLPVVVPANTALVGDELRSTVVQPKPANDILVNDKEKTISSLNRIKALIPSIVSNTPVVATSGNTASQAYLFTANDSTASARVTASTTEMVDILKNGLTAASTNFTLPTPTGGSNNAFTAGYLNAARLVYSNKAFLQAEISAWIDAQIVANTVPFNGFVYAGTDRTKCERDIGYIVDALRYDLTYGGNLATQIAARSYYSNGVLVEVGEKSQALAVQTYLKSIIDNIILADNSGWTKTPANTQTQVITGPAGSAGAVTTAQTRVQEIYDCINTGTTPTTVAPDITWPAAALLTANTNIQAVKSMIQTNVLAWIDNAYPDLTYNTTTCSRDVGYIVDALCYDMLFGNTFLSSWNAMSYYRALSSTAVVLDKQYQAQVGMIGFISASLKAYTGSTSGSVGSFVGTKRVVSAAETIYDIVNTGAGAIPSFQFSTPTGYNTSGLTNTAYASTGYATGNTANFGDGKAQIVQNYDFIVADTLQYYANGSYGYVWSATTTEGRDKGKRDIKYILDAIQHDMTYGGNYQSLVAGSAYYSSYLLNISAAEKPAFLDLFVFMKTLIGKIVRKDAITAQVGNTVARVSTGTAGSAAAGAFAEDRVQNVIDWITNGTGPTAVAPYYGWANADLQTAYSAIQNKRTEIALDANGWVQKYYQNVELDLTLTTRDAGLVVDAIALDMVLGTNFNAMSAGRAYLRGTTSTTTLLNGPEKAPTLGAINFIKYKVKNIAASGSIAQLQTTIDDITGSITGGVTPRINYPVPVLPDGSYSTISGTNLTGSGSSATFNFVRTAAGFTTSVAAGGTGYSAGNTIKILGSSIGGATPANDIVITVLTVSTGAISTVSVSTFNDAVVLLEDNRSFILEEVIAYINYTYPSLVYDKDLTKRDAGYILDALHYDLTYGGDFASQQAGQAYYTFGTSEISTYVKTATLDAISRLSTVAQLVIQSSAVTPTAGNTGTQILKASYQQAGSAYAATTLGALVTKIYNYVNSGLTSGAPVITITTVATANTFTSNAHGLANGDLVEPQTTPSSGQGGYGLVANTTYYVVNAATNTFQLAATYGGTAIATFTNGTGLSLVAHKTNMPYIGWVSSALIQQYSTLSGASATLQNSVITYIDSNYQNLSYSQSLARRDAGKAIDAVAFDIMFNSNFRSTKAGQSYNRPQSSELKGRLYSSTTESLKYLQKQITDTVTANSTAVTRANVAMKNIIDHIKKGSGETPEMNGTVLYNNNTGIIVGANILRENIDFLSHEATAWVNSQFGGTVTTTSSTGNVFTTSNTHNLSVGDPIRFTFSPITVVATATTASSKKVTLSSVTGIVVGMPVVFTGDVFGGVSASTAYWVQSIAGSDITISTTNGGSAGVINADASGVMAATVGGVIGGITAEQTYYVLTTPSITTFTITDTQYSSTAEIISDMTGSMIAEYAFDEVSCRRDMSEFLSALIYDVQYTGNYKSKRAAELYLNAVNGSELSNMWLVRNSTGVRNMTMSGLSGPLSVENEYGTKRPEGGSYTSLDPGFGPYDSNAWVNSRSCYVQNCSLFGVGATALKIDGSLHAGGNRSIVANDYTTFISDGIGVWCTGANSLTELVSVFAYFSYAGYIAELGGRIRATNGNSSYGTYGVIAEGVDTYEVPLYATLNNRGEDAYITNVMTDAENEVLRVEFANAGTNYTNASWTISGAGYNAAAIGDEFRDYGVFETRLTDLNDGYGYGGTGYITAANAAQLSSVGYITIAASDTRLSTAYTGMRVVITAGTGVGQYAAILSYNNGSKVAQVYKESFTTLTVTATSTTNNLLTVASTATIYPGMPIYLTGTMSGTGGITGLSANTVYYVRTANFSGTQFSVSTDSVLKQAGAAVTISNNVTALSITLYAAGWDNAVPGKTTYDSLDLTTTYIIEPRITYTAPGYTATARTLATTATWQAVTYAAGNFLAIPTGSTATTFSANGTTWSGAGNLPNTGPWIDVVYGGGEGASATAIVGGLGGIGAQLTAVLGSGLTDGQVVEVIVVSGGYGYLTAPTIEFVSASGIGAVGTAVVLDGEIKSVTMSITGSGYLTVPTVNVRTDVVTGITLNYWGKNYTSAPTVTISTPGGVSTTAWAPTTSVSNGTYLITDTSYIYLVTGSGTTGAAKPTHTSGAVVNGSATLTFYGRQATGTAVLTNNGVSSITVGSGGGLGYTTTPTITIVDSNAKFIAIPTTAASGTTKAAYQTVTGATTAAAWSQSSGSLPNGTYAGIAYGAGYWVAVGGTTTATRSVDGSTWSTVSISAPGAGSYSAIAYGNGVFVAIATGTNVTAVSTTSGNSWASGGTMPSSTTWTSIAYGNGRFVAIASGSTSAAYSINKGTSWTASPAGLPSSVTWTKVTYGQGLFMAVASGTTVCATSPDGVTWTLRAMPSSSNWKSIAFGNPTVTGTGANPIFAAISATSGQIGASIRTGATAQGRVKVGSNIVTEIRMIEPGSGYPRGVVTATTTSTNVISTADTTNLVVLQPVEFTGLDAYGLVTGTTYYVTTGSIVANTSFKVSADAALAAAGTAVNLTSGSTLSGTYKAGPIITQTDPNKTRTAPTRVRMGVGALGNPSFTDRGTNNTTATANTTGDGYADLYQASNFINVSGLYQEPTAGANVEFASISGTWYKLVAVNNLLGSEGNYSATFQINPSLSVLNAPAHGDVITTRLKYSQVRLTGHDFLYIGTGGTAATNYPEVDVSTAITANQTLGSNGGRVFFTSTDQDGNFNVGGLFGVQQATGTATLNASAFNLSGLQSLQLGTVSVGAGSAVITSFSTDPYFTANSDSILPTQKAIKSYITAQIGGGQSSLNVNTLTSGVIYVANNTISTTAGQTINVKAKMNFTGGIDGAPVALAFFMQR